MLEKVLLPITYKMPYKEIKPMITFLTQFGTQYFYLLHVKDSDFYTTNNAEKWMEEIIYKLEEDFTNNTEFTYKVFEGHVSTKICAEAVEKNTSYIYIVPKRKGILRRIIVGSISRDVIAVTEKPTLVHKYRPYIGNIPDINKYKLNSVLFATDFGAAADRAMYFLKDLRESINKLILLNVRLRAPDPTAEELRRQDVEDRLNLLKKELEPHFNEIKSYSRVGMASKVINNFAEEKKVDLIVLGRFNHPGSSKILGSTSERVVSMSKASLFLVP